MASYCRAVKGRKFVKRDSWPELNPKDVPTSHESTDQNSDISVKTDLSDDFPKLGALNKPRIKSLISDPESNITIIKQDVKKRHKKRQKVDINILQAIQASLVIKSLKKNKEIKKRPKLIRKTGNPLDSDQPRLHKGKVRLHQKRIISPMKKIFILSRKISIDKVAFTPNMILLKNEISKVKNDDINIEQFTEAVGKISLEIDTIENQNIAKLASSIVHTNKFKGYCKNLVTKNLKIAVSELIISLRKFQDKIHARDEIKAHAKRRYVCGFKESKKFLLSDKAKALIVASDLEISEGLPSNKILEDIVTVAEAKNIPIIYAGLAKDIGFWTLKKSKISILAILSYDGANDTYKRILECWENAKIGYSHLIKAINDYLSSKHPKNPEMIDLDCIEKEIRDVVISKLLSHKGSHKPENEANSSV